MIDVSKLKKGDHYHNLKEGWLEVDYVERGRGCFKIWSPDERFLQVFRDGSDVDGDCEWSITEVAVAGDHQTATPEVKVPHENRADIEAKPIVSDGGSSSYYKLPNSLVEKVVQTSELQTEDIVEHVFDNDFDFGNIFKTLVRLHGLSKGVGKAGNTAQYECNKILYSIKKIDKRLSCAKLATNKQNGEEA